jgi:hypothetical protein
MRKVNLYLDNELWLAFRVASIMRKRSASAVIGQLMQAQLDQWAHEPATPSLSSEKEDTS